MLRNAVAGEDAATAASCACRAAIDECNSSAADRARWSCRVGGGSSRSGVDWHGVTCGLKKKSKMKKRAVRILVVTAQRPRIMVMPSSEGCAGAMGLSTFKGQCTS
eukprot:2649594-Pleurochrysis_carterae.AAC.3